MQNLRSTNVRDFTQRLDRFIYSFEVTERYFLISFHKERNSRVCAFFLRPYFLKDRSVAKTWIPRHMEAYFLCELLKKIQGTKKLLICSLLFEII